MDIIKISGDSIPYVLRSNSYLVVDNNQFFIIDSSMPISKVEQALGKKVVFDKSQSNNKNMYLVGVVVTHCHADHIACIQQYIEKEVPIYLSQMTLNNIKSGESITCADMILDYPLIVDMDKIKVNILKDKLNIFNDHIFKIKSTIGHTNDSITIYDDSNLFCGDLIFDGGGIGRIDLPTGDYGDIIVSIDWLNTLDKNMIVHSGHGNDFQLKDFFENFDF